MKKLIFKAAACLALPVFILGIALLSAFQNPGRFSGAVGRQEFNDSLATRRDSIRSITGRIDTIIGPNGNVYIQDGLVLQDNLTMADTLKINQDSLLIFHSTDTTRIAVRSNATFILDYDNNSTASLILRSGSLPAGTTLLTLREATGNTLALTLNGSSTIQDNQTVTDTNFVGSQRIGTTGTVLKGVQIATSVNNVLMIIIDSGADTLFYGPPDSTKVH